MKLKVFANCSISLVYRVYCWSMLASLDWEKQKLK